jgi:hypothetical protein
MEGVGLIKKISKNTYKVKFKLFKKILILNLNLKFQWVGKTYISDDNVEDQLDTLKDEMDRLTEREAELDR